MRALRLRVSLWPGTNEPIVGIELELVDADGSTCEYVVTLLGEQVGTLTLLEDFSYLAEIPALGETCLWPKSPHGPRARGARVSRVLARAGPRWLKAPVEGSPRRADAR
ncbi:MAG: hypothetical protein HYV07_08175 [Deltaproteobacteria bacterium]|nr:hypothetical protein [Deltaproteobacteria bacterium]